MKGRDEALAAARAHLAELGPGDPGRAELEAAIARVTDKVEEEGAQKGFISQQYPTSGMPLEKDLPKTEPTAGLDEKSHRSAGGLGPYSMVSDTGPATMLPTDVMPRESVETAQQASRRIAQRPPEHIMPPGPTHPLLSPLAAIYDYLPTWAGGNTQMWEEPKLIEFRSDPEMRAALGPGIDSLGTDSEQYKDYADRRWAEAHDTAAATGANIVRQSQATGAGAALNQGITSFARGIDGIIGGAAPLVTLGMGDTPEFAAARDESPFGSGIGSLLGAMEGGAGALGKGAARLTGFSKALEGVPGYGSAALRGAATGGLTAGGVQGAMDFGDAMRGNPHEDEIKRIALASGIGAIGGTAAGLGGASTRGLRDANTEPGRQLNLIETALAGGEGNEPVRATRMFGGLRMTPGAERAAAESKALGLERGASPTDLLARDVADPIAKAAFARNAAHKAEVELTKSKFYQSNAGRDHILPRETIDTAIARLRRGTYDDGSPIPLDSQEMRDIKRLLNDGVTVEPIPLGADRGWANRFNGTPMSIDEARSLGVNVPTPEPPPSTMPGHWETEMLPGELPRKVWIEPKPIPVDTSKVQVLLVPKPTNAQQLDLLLENIDSNANAASARGAENPIWAQLQKAGRVDRDKFEYDRSLGKVDPIDIGNGVQLRGWGAYNHRVGDEITAISRDMLNAGIPQGKNVGIEQATQGVRDMAKGFRAPERDVNDQALMSFLGGQTSPLWDITSARYGRGLQPSKLSRTGIAKNLQLRLDPTAARAEKYGMPLGVAAGAGNLGPGIAAGYHDIVDAIPFSAQDIRDKLSGTKKPHENHPRRGR